MEIDLPGKGMVGQIAMLKMVMAKTEAMIGILVHGGAMIGMELEGLNAMIGAASETGRHPMTALAEEDARLLLSAIDCLLVVSVIKLVDLCLPLCNQFEQSVM